MANIEVVLSDIAVADFGMEKEIDERMEIRKSNGWGGTSALL